MMERAEATGFGVALVLHAGLIAMLSLAVRNTLETPPPAMEVSFVEDVGMVSSAPASIAPPAPAVGEEIGPAEEAAGEAAAAPEEVPEPTPPPPPPRAETGERRRPDVTRNAVPIRPPVPRPIRVAEARPRPTPPRPARPQQRTGSAQGQAQRSRGSVLDRLSREFGRGPAAAQGRSPQPQGAVVTARVRASLDQAILRALLPCQRQPLPAPEARAIRVRVAVTLNRDGSLASASVTGVTNNDTSLRQYERRMREIAVSVVRQCTPIRGLPAEYYAVARGWRQFNYTFPRT